MEAAEQTIEFQPKPNRRGWFDDECRKALGEKNAAYKKWIDRPTRAKRMEYEKLRIIAHNICKYRKRTHMDNHVRDIKKKHLGQTNRECIQGGCITKGCFPTTYGPLQRHK